MLLCTIITLCLPASAFAFFFGTLVGPPSSTCTGATAPVVAQERCACGIASSSLLQDAPVIASSPSPPIWNESPLDSLEPFSSGSGYPISSGTLDTSSAVSSITLDTSSQASSEYVGVPRALPVQRLPSQSRLVSYQVARVPERRNFVSTGYPLPFPRPLPEVHQTIFPSSQYQPATQSTHACCGNAFAQPSLPAIFTPLSMAQYSTPATPVVFQRIQVQPLPPSQYAPPPPVLPPLTPPPPPPPPAPLTIFPVRRLPSPPFRSYTTGYPVPIRVFPVQNTLSIAPQPSYQTLPEVQRTATEVYASSATNFPETQHSEDANTANTPPATPPPPQPETPNLAPGYRIAVARYENARSQVNEDANYRQNVLMSLLQNGPQKYSSVPRIDPKPLDAYPYTMHRLGISKPRDDDETSLRELLNLAPAPGYRPEHPFATVWTAYAASTPSTPSAPSTPSTTPSSTTPFLAARPIPGDPYVRIPAPGERPEVEVTINDTPVPPTPPSLPAPVPSLPNDVVVTLPEVMVPSAPAPVLTLSYPVVPNSPQPAPIAQPVPEYSDSGSNVAVAPYQSLPSQPPLRHGDVDVSINDVPLAPEPHPQPAPVPSDVPTFPAVPTPAPTPLYIHNPQQPDLAVSVVNDGLAVPTPPPDPAPAPAPAPLTMEYPIPPTPISAPPSDALVTTGSTTNYTTSSETVSVLPANKTIETKSGKSTIYFVRVFAPAPREGTETKTTQEAAAPADRGVNAYRTQAPGETPEAAAPSGAGPNMMYLNAREIRNILTRNKESSRLISEENVYDDDNGNDSNSNSGNDNDDMTIMISHHL